MHEGITEEDIFLFVDSAQKTAKSRDINMILFFDEINTNVNISGLLKEILIDRHYFGNKLDFRISIVAACNPYVIKTDSEIED